MPPGKPPAPHPGAAALTAAPCVVLGTASAARRRVFDRLAAGAVFSYTVEAADIDERAIRKNDAVELVVALARAKARALLPRLPRAGLLVTADQVVTWGGEIREKPRDAGEAASFLRDYRAGPPTTVSAVAVTDLATRRTAAGTDTVQIEFDPATLSEENVATLAADPVVLGCAGGVAVERPLLANRTTIRGDLESVFGLPPGLTLDLVAAVAAGGGEAIGEGD